MTNYADATNTMENLTQVAIGSGGTMTESVARGIEIGALQAQVYATLALVDAQREATEWGKEQITIMRDQQAQFLADLKAQLDDQ